MKPLNKALLGAGLLLSSSVAMAEPIVMDLSAIGQTDDPFFLLPDPDSDTTTDPFGAFKLDAQPSNVSTYLDSNGTAGIQTGDFVFDAVEDLGVSLDPVGSYDTTEGLGTTWTMNIDYYLAGFTVLVPDADVGSPVNYVGVFTEGEASIDLYDEIGDVAWDDVMVLDFLSATSTVITEGASAVKFTFELTSVLGGLFFNGSGTDFADLLEEGVTLSFVANADLSGQGEAPAFTGDVDVETGFDIYTRETSLGSIDLRLVPEPSSLAAFAVLLLGFVGVSRLSKSKSKV